MSSSASLLIPALPRKAFLRTRFHLCSTIMMRQSDYPSPIPASPATTPNYRVSALEPSCLQSIHPNTNLCGVLCLSRLLTSRCPSLLLPYFWDSLLDTSWWHHSEGPLGLASVPYPEWSFPHNTKSPSASLGNHIDTALWMLLQVVYPFSAVSPSLQGLHIHLNSTSTQPLPNEQAWCVNQEQEDPT